jgi:hypothetical protein
MLTFNDRVGFNRLDLTGTPQVRANVTFPQAGQPMQRQEKAAKG